MQVWCFCGFQAAKNFQREIGSCKYAGQGIDEHERRQRLLALTGWSAEVLKPEMTMAGAAKPAAGAPMSSIHISTSGVIYCSVG